MISKILAGVTLAMSIAMFFMWKANASLNKEIGSARVSIEQAELSNRSNLDAIGALQAGLNSCVSERRVDEQQNAVVVAQLARDLEASQTQASQVRIVREEIFREPSCAELGAIDIGAACPALSASLFDSANRIN